MPRNPLVEALAGYLTRLRFPVLFVITATLFVFDLFVPDFVPLVDELLLALATVLFASWKNRRQRGDDDARRIPDSGG